MPGAWHVYIDESGRFESNHEALCVAGWAAYRERPHGADFGVSEAIRAIDPDVPFPPHAAFYNMTGYWIVPALRYAKREVAGKVERPEFRAALAAFDRWSDAQGRTEIRRAAMSGEEPDFTTVKRFDRWLRDTARAAWMALEAPQRRFQRGMVELMTKIGRDLGSDRGGCFLVAACDAPRQNPPRDLNDTYLWLLRALLERTAQAIIATSTAGTVVDVRVHVSRRRVSHEGLVRSIEQVDVDRQANAVVDTIGPGGPIRARLKFWCTRPLDYHDKPSGGIVLADFVANHLRSRVAGEMGLRGRWAGPGGFANRASVTLGLPSQRILTGFIPDIPTAACDGVPLVAVRAAVAGEMPPPIPATVPRWGAEQAAMWIEGAAALRQAGVWP
jgi:hypothetical protein